MTSDDPTAAAKDIAAKMKAATDQARGTVGDAAASLSDRVGDMAGSATDKASDAYRRVRDGAADLGDRLPSGAGDAMEAGKRAYRSGSDQIARQVGRQPIEALLLAGAIGYLVGWAANRS